MNPYTSPLHRLNVRSLIASLLAYMLLTSQLAPIALAIRPPPVITNSETSPSQPLPASSKTKGNDRDNRFAPVPVPLTVSPVVLVPSITATKVDTYPSAPGGAQPGEIITYSVTITNNGTDATNVTLSDTVDTNTAIVGTPKSTPIGFNDAFNVIGNVRIQVPDGAPDLLANDRDPDTDTNAGLTITTLAGDNSAPFAGTSANGGQVTAATGDGSFQYNPPPGFTGSDTFTYTVTDSDLGTSTATVTLTVTGLIWFVNSLAAAGGDGRLTTPFNCYTGTSGGGQSCFSDTAADDPGDSIFLFSGNYTGGFTLANNQRLIGQGATDTLANIAGVTVPTFSDALPATGGGSPVITTTAAATSAVPLGSGNHLRGFTVGNTTGTKISGNSFGTLTVGNNTSPDVILNGSGRALGLVTGTFAATSGFASVATTSSTAQGILLTSVAGTVSLGSTSVSGSTTQGILVSTSTADINFGTTAVGTGTAGSGGTDAVSFQNNASGTRTFSALTIQNNTLVGFLHAVAGGTTTVTGATTITNPGGIGISVDGSTTLVSFNNANVTQSGGAGVSFTNNANANGDLTFADLDISPDANQIGLTTNNNTGTITSTSGTITTSGASALSITTTPLALVFDGVTTTGGTTPGISLTTATGSLSAGNASSLTGNNSSAPFTVSGGTVSVTYSGNISQAGPAAALLSISGGHNTGTINFNNSLALILATGGTGAQFDNADGTYTFTSQFSCNGGNAGVDIINGSDGTFTFGTSANISNPSGSPFEVTGGTANITYNGAVTKTAGTAVATLNINNHSTGTITFQGGAITANIGTGLQFGNADGTYNISVASGSTGLFGGDAGIDIIAGSSGTFTFGNGTTPSLGIVNPSGIAYRENTSTANVTYNGGIDKTNNANSAVDIGAKTGGTTTFTGQINASTTTANAISLVGNTGGTINFNASGNGLDIVTTTGIGFNATGGATVTVTAAGSGVNGGNTISSGTGPALNINATNIGANDVTFQSISASGGTNSIVLTTTGSLGGLHVTGTDGGDAGTLADTGTGGTIASTTGDSISLNDTDDVFLGGMTITNSGNDNAGNDNSNWIDATSVIGITLQNVNATDSVGHGFLGSNVTNLVIQDGLYRGGGIDNVTNFNPATPAGDANFHGFFITNLLGTSSITGTTFERSNTVQFRVNNNTATNFAGTPDTLTVSDTTWQLHGRPTFAQNPGAAASPFHGDHFSVTSDTGANFRLNVDSSVGQNVCKTAGICVQAAAGGTNGKMDANISGIQSGGNTGGPTPTFNDDSNTAMAVIAETGGGSVTYDILNNTSLGTGSLAIAVTHASAGGTSTGNIIGNTITHVAGPGTNALQVIIEGTSTGGVPVAGGTGTVRIANNTITGNFQRGIEAGPRIGTSVLNATIDNNTLTGTDTSGNALQQINISSGGSGNDHANTLRLNMHNNQVNLGPGAIYTAAYRLVNDSAPATTIFQLQDFNGVNTVANVQNWVTNVKTNGGTPVSVTLGLGFTASAGPIPVPPPPLLAAPGGVWVGQPGSIPVLTQAELDVLFVAANERWTATGLTTKQIAAMRNVKFEIADLPGVYLAEVAGDRIRIDRDAAGYGWFVDSTPMDDMEFGNTISGLRRYTDPVGAPAGRMDLLTAIMHEIGHRAGLSDSYSVLTRNDLMYGYLTKGERRLPFKTQALYAISSGYAGTHFVSVEPNTETLGQRVAGGAFGKAAYLGAARPFVTSPHQQASRSVIKTPTETVGSPAPTVESATRIKPPRKEPPKPIDPPGGNPPVVGPGGCVPSPGGVPKCTNLTWNVGTLPAGQSVTITFQVVVDNPYNGGPNVSNQGSISFGGGGGPVLTDDPSVGGASDPTVTPIAVPIDAFVRDARVAEPTSGTTSMLFTVALATPATQMTTINYDTANGTAVEPGDYVKPTAGSSIVFQIGEQLKVIPITVNSDVDGAEGDEDFTLTIAGNPTVVNIVTPSATGTITAANPPGTVLISEFRTVGPGMANDPNDEFVEIYNNTDTPLTVAASDASPGFGLFKMGVGSCDATPILVGTIPNGTIIPARGHYLFVGATYSLAAYATGDATLTADIDMNANIGLFNTTNILNLSTETRLDAVGEGTNTSNLCALLAEGNNLPALNANLTSLGQHSFFRSLFTPGTPKDTNDNAADFLFVDTNGTIAGAGQRLGAPGPENLASPIKRDLTVVLLDASVPAANPPNRVRDLTSDPPNNSTFGTLSIRRRVVNNTGGPVTRLRFRIVDITTFPPPAGTADLRGRTSVAVMGVSVNDGATCAATGTPATAPCTVTVQGTTLETPPAQPNGGGYNATLAAGTITTGTPLAAGASVNVQFFVGVQQTGAFRVFVIVEALP